MKKVIFINQYVTHLFADIINDFVSHNVEVILVTGSIHSSHPLSEKIRIIKFTAYRRGNFISRLITWILFGIRVFFYLLNKRYPIFITTNPPFLPILGLIYFRLKRQPVNLLFYDLYPEALNKMGYIQQRNFLYKYWIYLNKKVLKIANNIFTISTSLKEGLKKYNIENKPIHIVFSWADHNYIKPLEKNNNPFVLEHNLTDRFVVLYSGNLGITHDIDTIMQTADQIKNEENLVFLIIGEGTRKKEVAETANKLGLKNVLLLSWQPEDQLPLTFSSADIGIVSLGAGAEGLSVPSKTYSYLAAGCALLVIAEKESELEHLVHDYHVGEIFRPGDVQGVCDFILRLKRDSSLLEYYKRNAREASMNFGTDNAKLFYKIINHDKGTTS